MTSKNRRMATRIVCAALSLSVFCLLPAYAQSVPRGEAKQTQPAVRIVYLIPSDRSQRQDYELAIKKAIENVQVWYLLQMSGKTFGLSKPVVEALYTNHPANFYATNPVGSDAPFWFFFNAVADGFALTGGEFDDPKYRWVFYLDADPACGQLGGGAAAGVALLPANDLRGLVGEANIPPCSFEPPDTHGVCRWVGGLGHELGHTFGLPHPDPCPGGASDDALMCVGYIIYPFTYLLPTDRTILDASPFFLPSRRHAPDLRHLECKER
jgi:hypothetical protein